jgi:tRNA1Val (adenine37-N6)-methyltransferase
VISQPFQFKQFKVAHDKCAMKVNTDGVLLGAWQGVEEAENILDIGTGSGVIALMMAQKNQRALIDAIDIDQDAFEQAKENFANSIWSDRLKAIHCSVQAYFPSNKYDIIISNPPYFIDDQKAPDPQKNIARHGVTLDYETLLTHINRLLTDKGKALVALPVFNLSIFESLANTQKLYLVKVTEVTAASDKPAYLMLVQLEKAKKALLKSSIQIQYSNGEFTEHYKTLTRDFYLKF